MTKWNFTSDKPIYMQIVEQVKEMIVSGELQAGCHVPTVRELAADAEVNPNTVQRALAELEQTGLIFANRTSGRFVTDNTELINNTRSILAYERIAEFLSGMKQLGYSEENVIDLIKRHKED